MQPLQAFGCNVREFGAIGDGREHRLGERFTSLVAAQVVYPSVNSLDEQIDGAAFQAALDAIGSLSQPPEHPPHTDSRGNLLFVPFGDYQLDKTLHLTRPLILQGVSSAGGCTLHFAAGIDGIVVDGAGTSKDGGAGGWCVIRDLMVASTEEFGAGHSAFPALNEDDPLTADPLTHSGHPEVQGSGIVLFDRAVIENCTIVGFQYDGIHVEAIDPNKNANTWAVRTSRVFASGRHGFYSAGGENANAGVAVGLFCGGNSGWGVYDRSFFGDTFIGCAVEANGHRALDIRSLLVHSSGVYAGTADGGLQWSPDAGVHWSAVNTGLTVTHDTPGVNPGDPPLAHPALIPAIQALAAADLAGHQAPFVLWAGTDPGWQFDTRQGGVTGQRLNGAAVFSSGDGAMNWDMIGHDLAGLTATDVRAIAAVPTASGQVAATLYAGTAGGVFKTTDSGTTWQATDTTGLTSPDVRALAIDPQAPATVYAGTAGGVFKTTDSGTTWRATDTTGLNSPDVRALAIDPQTPATLYAGTAGGVFKTTDSGTTWQATDTTGLTSPDVRALAIDPQTPATLYAGTPGGVFKTTDSGTSWQATETTYYGGAYKTTSELADNVFVGCYSESGEGSGSEFSRPTIVLGGKQAARFGPLTSASLITNVTGIEGIIGLPLRSPVVHKTRTIKGDPAQGVFGANADDEVILANAEAGAMVFVLPPVLPPLPDITGQQLTIKKADDTTHLLTVETPDSAPIDGKAQDVNLEVPHASVTLIALRDGWQIISRSSG